MKSAQSRTGRPKKGGAGRQRRPWSRDRAGKELAMIEAFDELVRENGVHQVQVNSVIARAGVGKSLLYVYFGGLSGLAEAWARTKDFLPSDSEIVGADKAAYDKLPTDQQLIGNYQRYARALRARPRALAVMAGELVGPTEVTRALEKVRSTFGQGLQRYFSRPDEYAGADVVALQVLLNAAVCYLAMRAHAAPKYFDLRLDQPTDWAKVEDMIELLVERVLAKPNQPPRQPAKTKPRQQSVSRRSTHAKPKRQP